MKIKLISIFLCSIFFIGCTNPKIENISVEKQIYESPYERMEEDVIKFQDLQEELKKNGIELSESIYPGDGTTQDGYEHYYFGVVGIDGLRVNIYNQTDLKEDENQIVNSIEIYAKDGTELSSHSFIKSLVNVMGDEKFIPWLTEQEEKLKKPMEIPDNHHDNYMSNIMVTGRNYVLFSSSQRQESKELEFYWGIEQGMTRELEGIVAELENQGLLMTSYINGFTGDQMSMASPEYYLTQNNSYYYNNREQIKTDVEKAVAYKVMYDPDANYNYSVQLYGLMPEDLGYMSKVEDMAGIDTISRVMDMGWEDFTNLTNTINVELTKARELLNPNLQREYNIEGKIGEYYYEIYVPSDMGIYRFTVLIEKE